MKKALLEAIMAAWVRGWYAGLEGKRNDDGKREAAAEIFRSLMKDLGLHEDAEHGHLWGFWIDSLDKPGQEFQMCDKCGTMEYRDKAKVQANEKRSAK